MKIVRSGRTGRSGGANLTTFPLLILITAPFVLAGFVFANKAPQLLLRWGHCSLREVTGIPCPSCGSTLAVTQYASGQWWAAIASNPLLALLVAAYSVILLWTIAATIMPRWRRTFEFTSTEKKTAIWMAVFLVIINWLWLLPRY